MEEQVGCYWLRQGHVKPLADLWQTGIRTDGPPEYQAEITGTSPFVRACRFRNYSAQFMQKPAAANNSPSTYKLSPRERIEIPLEKNACVTETTRHYHWTA
jgi:hypothetical protein